MDDAPVRLNIGGGDVDIEGFINVDRKHGMEAFPLAYDEGSVDEIRASHVLEHFPYKQVEEVVKNWVSRLKPGGCLRLAVPDFLWIADQYQKKVPIPVQSYTMGGQEDGDDYHRSIFDKEALGEVMVAAGLERIRSWTSEVEDCATLPCSLNMMGYRATSDDVNTEHIRAVLSCPRYGPLLHSRCAFNALGRARIQYSMTQGAYWWQVLSVVIEKTLKDDKVEFIITLDYDSVFTHQDILELWRLIRAKPEADAVCAVQIKRGGETSLVCMYDKNDQPRRKVYAAEFQMALTKMRRGHFGLTIFRASSLRNQMRPWMVPKPGPDGLWDGDNVDADIDFWNRWHDAGKSIYLANRVVVGHIEEVIGWPGVDLLPVYQNTQNYTDNGIPKDVVR